MPKNLEASIEIAASPAQVWSVLTDLGRISEFSPTTRKMIALGGVRTGTFTLNINKDGWKIWPTTSRIVRFEPNQVFAFQMNENRTVWSYELEPTATGTRVTESRVVAPKGVPAPVRGMINVALGGEQQFEANLVSGMRETLARVKAAAER
ncbi:SRPBCC family protein [Nocardia sp. NPDC058176]|uniref:SRPBCC family protein n=1 Tax=Nocardia sp. NPDC058176 TaxID=3346368 RepID=UPI0036D944E9